MTVVEERSILTDVPTWTRDTCRRTTRFVRSMTDPSGTQWDRTVQHLEPFGESENLLHQ